MIKTPEATAIVNLLRAARAERSADNAQSTLRAALKRCDEWIANGGGVDAVLLKVQSLTDLATESATPRLRSQYWQFTLDAISRYHDEPAEQRLAACQAAVAVDCFQDPFSNTDQAARLQILRAALRRVDAALRQQATGVDAAILLARKAALLRHIAIPEVAPTPKKQRIAEAHRCAARALTISRSKITVLEAAQSEWALARYESTDRAYAERIRTTETLFLDPTLRDSQAARLAVARFYRMTYQPLLACETYPTGTTGSMNPRQ
ncbi:MAG: hypothetical protein R3F14_11785 [Polyangiaceae bacterium]